MKSIVGLVALAGIAAVANAQSAPMLSPIAAVLRYEVSAGGSPWSSSVTVQPGAQVEWRVVVEYTGPAGGAVALGQLFYQPLLSGVDQIGVGTDRDNLGPFANGGRSSANPAIGLTAGMLTNADGNSTAALPGYGRVKFGNTARGMNTSTSNWNALTSIDDSPGVMRVAGINTDGNPANNGTGVDFGRYDEAIPGSATPNQINRVLAGVMSDNGSPSSTWFQPGLDTNTAGEGLVVFRQAIDLADSNLDIRTIMIGSTNGSARRRGGAGRSDDRRFMSWQVTNDVTLPVGGLLVGYDIASATINVVPTPASLSLLGLGGLVLARRRRAASRSN